MLEHPLVKPTTEDERIISQRMKEIYPKIEMEGEIIDDASKVLIRECLEKE